MEINGSYHPRDGTRVPPRHHRRRPLKLCLQTPAPAPIQFRTPYSRRRLPWMSPAAAARSIRKLRTWAALRSVAASPSSLRRPPSSEPFFGQDRCPVSSEKLVLVPDIRTPKFLSMVPALLAGVFGIGLLEVIHADAHEEDFQSQTALTSPSDYADMVKVISEERKRLEDVLKNKGMLRGSYPSFYFSVKGQQVAVKFRIAQTCNVSHMIADLVARLVLKAEEDGSGSRMILSSWDSAAAWQLSLSHSEKQDIHQNRGLKEKNKDEGALCLLMFESLITSEEN